MKVLVKQSCQIEDMVMGPNIHKKPGTFIVPGFFVFHPYFVSLVKDEKIKILEADESEFKDSEEAAAIRAKFDVKDVDAHMIAVLEGIITKEGDDEESDDSDDDASDDESSQGSESDEDQTGSESKVVSPGENADEVKKDEAEELLRAEYEALHEKAKRLNKSEKKRYDELKSVLKIEE